MVLLSMPAVAAWHGLQNADTHTRTPTPDIRCLLHSNTHFYLQAYTVKKRLESYMRRLVSSAHAISAVSPGFYAARFRAAMKKLFV
jgi:hypothetical protein